MHDRDGMNPPSLAEALRALPPAEPQPDLWPEVARSLRARRRRAWRYAVPAALAAGLALFVLAPRPVNDGPAVPASSVGIAAAGAPVAASAEGELSALHERSQALERWIATATVAPLDSRDLMAAVEVEDLIGLVDVQLGATRSDADALPLWRQRVALLEDLATIRVNRYAIAAN